MNVKHFVSLNILMNYLHTKKWGIDWKWVCKKECTIVILEYLKNVESSQKCVESINLDFSVHLKLFASNFDLKSFFFVCFRDICMDNGYDSTSSMKQKKLWEFRHFTFQCVCVYNAHTHTHTHECILPLLHRMYTNEVNIL